MKDGVKWPNISLTFEGKKDLDSFEPVFMSGRVLICLTGFRLGKGVVVGEKEWV